MRLKTGYAFSANNLFEGFDVKLIKTNHKILKEHYNTHEKKEMAVKVFLYAIYLILLDIIENNITFVLPSNKKAQFQMKTVQGQALIDARKNGKFLGFDMLATNQKAYYLEYVYWNSKSEKSKEIYVNKDFKDKIMNNANNGKVYF